LASLSWSASPADIAEEKYSGLPDMPGWLGAELEDDVMWLDEVFANKVLKPSGNLKDFGKFVTGQAKILEAETTAFRTIEPRLLAANRRDFGGNARIFKGSKNEPREVPDWRDFVIIKMEGRR
jgi:hypothetical protein